MTELMEHSELMYEESTGDYEVRRYPNPVLTEVCDPIDPSEFGPEIERLGRQMIEMAKVHKGYGISAPQIGLLKRLFVMEFPNTTHDAMPPAIICNPVLESYEEGTFEREGCLSLPGVFEQVWRASETHMTYQTPYGETREMVLLDLEARIVQHEVDHLDGIMFFQRMSRNLRKGVLRAWEKTQPKKRYA